MSIKLYQSSIIYQLLLIQIHFIDLFEFIVQVIILFKFLHF